MSVKVQQKCTLTDVLYEYLGRPKTLREASDRMQEQLTPKERELLRDLQDRNRKS